MKILLINPPVEGNFRFRNKKRLRTIQEIAQPLGLASIAAVAENHGHFVRIIDCAPAGSCDGLTRQLNENKPEIVGITATSLSFAAAREIATQVRESLPDAVIVIGGPHVTALPRETMSAAHFDVGVIGEGEITFMELVKRIERTGLISLEDIAGLAYRNNGSVIVNKRRENITDLDILPLPARHLLPPLSAYSPFSASYRYFPVATIIGSRGCPMGCSFCDQAVFGTKHRSRTPRNIVDEIEVVKDRFGAREIRFYDDAFTWNPEAVLELCDIMKRRGLRMPWTCFASVNTVSRGLLERMKDAGCWQISFGLESGDPRVLKFLKKNITLEQNQMAVRLAREAGLGIRAHFVVGSPWETRESLERTLRFAKKSKVDYAHFTKFMPFPGSEAYTMLVAQGNNFDFTGNFSMLSEADIMYIPSSLTKEEFMRFRARAEKEFYLRFSYIIQKVFSIRTWVELKANVCALCRSELLNGKKHT